MNIFKYALSLPVICVLALAGGCADTPPSQTVTQPAPVATPQVAKADQDQDDVQCDTEVALGSHVQKHTVCTSQQDRDAMERDLGNLRSHGSGSTSH